MCCIVAGILAAVAVGGVAVLFSGRGASLEQVRLKEEFPSAFLGIPSDAVTVLEFGSAREAGDLCRRENMLPAAVSSQGSVCSVLAAVGEACPDAQAAVSLHYSGHNRISPLAVIYVQDGAASDAVAAAAGKSAPKLLCRQSGNYVLVTDSDVLMSTALRHIAENISIVDNRDFVQTAQAVPAGINLFISHRNLGKFFSGLVSQKYLGKAQFFQKFAFWSVLRLDAVGDDFMDMSGICRYNIPEEEFCHIFDRLGARQPAVFSMVPHYASFVVSVPVADFGRTSEAFDVFYDGSGRLDKVDKTREELASAAGIRPEDWAARLAVREVAAVRFEAGGVQQFVNLARCQKVDTRILFGGDEDMSDYTPALGEYRYKGFLASLFGGIFSESPEDCFTFVSGWLVSGSKEAVSEFISGKALELDMARYFTDAGLQDVISRKSLLTVVVNAARDPEGVCGVFRAPVDRNIAGSFASAPAAVACFCLEPQRSGVKPVVSLRSSSYEIPVVSRFERDTVVEVPTGPWKVKNSGTGRTNLMYQQKNMYICLTEENGKGIWSAPFQTPICGRIGQVDYFENGKLQMIFASGDKLYMIDRLGRMVRPFPVSLGKEVLLGPDVYDFDGNRKYSVMVLHKDNTLGLYDLQGEPVQGWKGYPATETVKDLPELMEVNGSLYWVVTTSRQTVICRFSGEPAADFSGSKMMRPGTQVKKVAGDVVEIECYNGKVWKLDLKSGRFSR